MTARKLSDSEKQDILDLYRTTGETSSSLASRYGVSTSTVSRLLKSSLPADEYEALIQQKRSMRAAEVVVEDTLQEPDSDAGADEIQAPVAESIPPEPEPVEPVRMIPVEPANGKSKPILRRSKQRSSSASDPDEAEVEQLEVPLAGLDGEAMPAPKADASVAEAEVLKEILSQNVIEPEEEDLSDDLEDELDDEDEDEDEDEDFDEDGSQPFLVSSRLKEGFAVQILPLEEAPIPRTCYLVVDRAAELVAPPLRDFGDLGQIPAEEVQAKTLPIFDNHRIAKRYSNPRTQRVIKLPDGRILSKTSSHLRAKGITRLLIDGRVYSLN
ncbi:MAG: helix-turn-helix domain-containing protein [Leptolyngbyaceae cyanobacterium bins.302]|nr:helix-turn-helix domain-containing protein [Leptolyngbyaceae cyanobacterium bins.302]